MSSWADSIAYWLIDYYLAATVLLIVATGGVWAIRQPARRIAVVWGTFVGLLVLALVCSLPGWPRHHIVPDLDHGLSAVPATQPMEDSGRQSATPPLENRNVDLPIAAAPNTEALPSPKPRSQNPTIQKPQLRTRQIQKQESPATAESPAEIAASPGFWGRLASRVFSFNLHAARLIGLLVFLAGCSLTVFRILHGMRAARRLCRRALQAPPAVLAQLAKVVGSRERCPQLLINSLYPVPIVTGTVRPTIVLPCQFAEEDRARDCRSVLAHEWAHIRNGDLWLLAIDRWLLPLLWIHPLYHWLRRSIQNDQELLADAAAAAQSSPVDYAEMLLHWARHVAAEQRELQMGAALGVWGRPAGLVDRIDKLLHQSSRVELQCSRRWRLASLAVLGLLPILLSTATVRPATVQAAAKPLAWQSNPVSSLPMLTGKQRAASLEDVPDPERQWEIEQPAIAEVRRLGGAITTEEFRAVRLVTEVNMVYGFTEEGARVENANLADESLPQIAQFRNLKVLALTGTQVTENGLHALSTLGRLERLCLWDARLLTDVGIDHIAALPRLRSLELSNAEITDASIARLSRIRTLEELSVQGGALTGHSLAHAAQIPNLKSLMLDLGNNPIEAGDLGSLRELARLRQLGLQCSGVSDETLRQIAGLKNLRLLSLGECRVSNAGLSTLRESLPNLWVITPQRMYPALSAAAASAECEQTLRHSQEAISVVRKFVTRLSAENSAAAAQLISRKTDVERQIATVRPLRAIANLEWNLAYSDSQAVLAVSTEFSDRFGGTLALVCTLGCVEGQWKIDGIMPTPAREGVEGQIRRFAAAHPKASAAQGWLPVTAEAR